VQRQPVTAQSLAEAAISYLNRHTATREQLSRRLETWVLRRGEPPDLGAARPLMAALLARYESSGLVDDKRLAEHAAERFRARGGSSRKIAARLHSRGISSSVIDDVLAAERRENPEPDLAAARALVAKRRLGSLRPPAERAPNRRRDLAVLARAGFDFDTAIRALNTSAEESDDF
jgi:regulatory protein